MVEITSSPLLSIKGPHLQTINHYFCSFATTPPLLFHFSYHLTTQPPPSTLQIHLQQILAPRRPSSTPEGGKMLEVEYQSLHPLLEILHPQILSLENEYFLKKNYAS